MLGYAIRVKDERNDTFYKNVFNLMNNFIVGENLEDARFYIDQEAADAKVVKLTEFLDSAFQDKTVRDFIKENNTKFDGFETVEIEFDEVFYYITVVCDKSASYVSKILKASENDYQICLAPNVEDSKRFFSKDDASDAIIVLDRHNTPLSKVMRVGYKFLNPRVFV